MGYTRSHLGLRSTVIRRCPASSVIVVTQLLTQRSGLWHGSDTETVGAHRALPYRRRIKQDHGHSTRMRHTSRCSSRTTYVASPGSPNA